MDSELTEDVPTFINDSFVENLVKKVENSEKVKMEKFELKPVTKKGNHYASVMIRIVVNYVLDTKEQKQISLILKTSYDEKYDNEDSVKLLKNFNLHNREMLMYGKILDSFHNLLSSINDKTTFSGRCYGIDHTTDSMIFEDLLVRQYRCANRIERLDLNHAKLVMKKLAKFHASSIMLKQKEPEVYASFNKAFLSRHHEDARDFCFTQLDAAINLVSKLPGYEYYFNKLVKFRELFVEKGIELYEPDQDFNVLLHGDMWTNNMMFKYDEGGNPIDVLFVDYQIPYWCTPAIDILYFINTSLKEEIRLEKQDELVQYYYKHLKETLIDGFKYDGKFPSLHEFQVIILKKSLQIVITVFIVQPIIILTEGVDTDLMMLMSKEGKGIKLREEMYNNPAVVEAIKKLLPYLDAKGILD
ncbi:hypothetical protein DMENIID0001_032390 [Sergentomyia squamirostris]